jgi:vacuolar-type H+-ATPase subunit I/STV1
MSKKKKEANWSEKIEKLTKILKSGKTLVKEADEFIEDIKDTTLGRELARRLINEEDYERGEVMDYGDKIELVQRVGVFEPNITYKDGIFVVEFGSYKEEFEVGNIDKDSINATINNDILSIKADKVVNNVRKVEEDKGHKNNEEEERASST